MRDLVQMKVGAGEHPLAPTFQAYEAIERALNSSLSQVYQAHFMGGLQLAELAEIVAIGMNAHKPNSADAADVMEHLFNQGPQADAVRRPIAEYLLALAWSPDAARKKFAAEWPLDSVEEAPPPPAKPRKRKSPARR